MRSHPDQEVAKMARSASMIPSTILTVFSALSTFFSILFTSFTVYLIFIRSGIIGLREKARMPRAVHEDE